MRGQAGTQRHSSSEKREISPAAGAIVRGYISKKTMAMCCTGVVDLVYTPEDWGIDGRRMVVKEYFTLIASYKEEEVGQSSEEEGNP